MSTTQIVTAASGLIVANKAFDQGTWINSVPVNMTEADMNQLANDIMTSPKVKVFVPKQKFHMLNGAVRTPFTKGLDTTKYDVLKHFLPHETRPWLERKMPCSFGIGSFDDLEVALMHCTEGVDIAGAHWDATMIGWVKGGEGATLMFVPQGTDFTDTRMVGILHYLAKTQDLGKFNKYEKRICAMYRHASFGKQTHDAGDLMVYRAQNGDRRKVRYNAALPKDFVIEGCGYATADWLWNECGPNPDRMIQYDEKDNPINNWKTGDACRITFSWLTKMFKGHIMCWPMDVDCSFWDCKSQIGTEEVFVGFMGPLHAGDLKLNIQPIVNFGLQEYAKKFGMLALEEFQDGLDSDKGIIKQVAKMYAHTLNNPDNDSIERWRLMLAMANGFDFNAEAFMQRDVYRSWKTAMFDIENGRVPVPEEFGFRAYYFVDPWVIGRDGRFHPELKRLAGNCVYSLRLNQGEWISMYRDPQTPNETVRVMNVAPPSGISLIDPNVMIVSIDIAMDFAGVQGGGDYDDCGNCMRGELMEHFHQHKPFYPKFNADVVATTVRNKIEENSFIKRSGLLVPVWNKRALIDLIQAAIDADAGVGMIVNYLLVRIALGFHKEHNIMDLRGQYFMATTDDEALDILADIDWYNNVDGNGFVLFEEQDIAANLEGAIDGSVMNGAKGITNFSNIADRIKAFWKTCRVIPAWALEGGYENHGRVPASCLAINPTIVYDPISIAFDWLKGKRAELDEFVNVKQQLSLHLPPEAIATYPASPDIKETVTAAQTAWRDDNKALREKGLDGKAAYEGFVSICKKHLKGLEARPMPWRLEFIAELERRTLTGYRSLATLRYWGEDHPLCGTAQPVFDGYLNNPSFFIYRVLLYRSNGLGSTMRFVPLYSGSEKLYNSASVAITVTDGVIARIDDEKIIGFDEAIPDADYTMIYGTIYV